MKIRTLKLTPEFLIHLLQGKASAFTSNLPGDAELLDIKMDLFTKQVFAVVRSESYEDIAENLPAPEIILTVAPESSPTSKSVFVRKAQTERGTSVAKPNQHSQGRYAIKMENEFSPEQRKLLSFTVKGDVVVAKPLTFLKTEWEDINEVVRSLGGKWIKGDIISYWEIPLE
jgi:hypothetical protein